MSEVPKISASLRDLRCPTCLMNWAVFKPAKIDRVNQYRCVECKAVYTGEMLAAEDLLEAAKRMLAHLEARIDAAPSTAKPIFDCIAELHDAITKATGAAP